MSWFSQWWNGLLTSAKPVPVPVPAPRPIEPVPTEPIDVASDVAELVRLINGARQSKSVPPSRWVGSLQPMARLNYSAQIWADWMDANQRLEHRSPLPAGVNGEIIAWGAYDAASTFQQWVNSPPHRAIMMDSRYRFCGFGRHGAYWCGVFSM